LSKYPELSLEHLLRLTDETGIIQHAKYHLPHRATGYTTDDNARALIAALQVHLVTEQPEALRLAENYLGFLHYAQLPSGQFHNFMRYDRSWIDSVGSEDSFGRALWALGTASAALAGKGSGVLAREMFLKAVPWVVRLKSPRSWAFSLIGIGKYLKVFNLELPVKKAAATVAQKLVAAYRREVTPKWRWFEDRLTYSNAILPAALFEAYGHLNEPEMLAVAEESLSFLTGVLWQDNYFKLVGCHGWYVRGKKRALWDEQPEDASCLVLAYSQAYHVTGDFGYLNYAEAAMDWFYGRNANGLSLYDPATGGCHDGLTPKGVNGNQGAESVLAYLLSRLEIATLTARTKEPALVSGSDAN
jgi:uncharacterized protein YyaL (SSP411 family)